MNLVLCAIFPCCILFPQGTSIKEELEMKTKCCKATSSIPAMTFKVGIYYIFNMCLKRDTAHSDIIIRANSPSPLDGNI